MQVMEHCPFKRHLRGKFVQCNLDITGLKKCSTDSPDIFGFSGKFLTHIGNYSLFKITLQDPFSHEVRYRTGGTEPLESEIVGNALADHFRSCSYPCFQVDGITIPDYNIKPVALKVPKRECFLSLIHISEPTRRTPISYAVFC